MDLFHGFPRHGTARKIVIDFGQSYSEIGCLLTFNDPPYGDLKESENIRIWALKCESKNVLSVLEKILERLEIDKTKLPIEVVAKDPNEYISLLKEKFGLSAYAGDLNKYIVEGLNLLLNEIEYETFTFPQNESRPLFKRFYYPSWKPCFIITMDDDSTIIKVASPESFQVVGRCGISWSKIVVPGRKVAGPRSLDHFTDMIDSKIVSPRKEAPKTSETVNNSDDGSQHSQGRNTTEQETIDSLLSTLCAHIVQIISLEADINEVSKVFFVRSFIGHNEHYLKQITSAIKHCSNMKTSAIFLRHESFIGVIGGLLESLNTLEKKRSCFEVKAGTSGFFPEEYIEHDGIKIMKLQINFENTTFVPGPLLPDLPSYNPDIIDLSENDNFRAYTISLVLDTIKAKANRTISKVPKDKAQLVLEFVDKVSKKLEYMDNNPYCFGKLNQRIILDIISQLKDELLMGDAYIKEKMSDNDSALLKLKDHLSSIDDLHFKERHIELAKGVLAGNLLDWGCKELNHILQSKTFGMEEAKTKLPCRPWLFDDLDNWINRMKGPPHKCAAIFVDNSGIDIILGIIPFARELIQRGTKVILCAVPKPVLNDVTVTELDELLNKVREMCPIINSAMENSSLKTMSTGQRGPNLDLSRIDEKLAEHLNGVDLLVIEGMGRAINGNLFEKFTCETLKIALVKDKMYAKYLGGAMLDAVFKYES